MLGTSTAPLRTMRWQGSLAALIAAVGIAALALEPALWVWRSWWEPSYESAGAAFAAVAALLVAASLGSGPALPDARDRRRAWQLFLLSACLRVIGRALSIHVVGALALVVDVAALARFLGLARRPLAISPLALAALAGLALPVEHLLQRLGGHPLQLLATHIAHDLLVPWFDGLTRHGTLLVHEAAPLAIDLPCSGARGLVLFGGVFTAALCVLGPSRGATLRGLALCAGGALLANALRVVLLFLGHVGGSPVEQEPLHTTLGLFALAIGALPFLLVVTRWPRRMPTRGVLREQASVRGQRLSLPAACGVLLVGLGVAFWPGQPRDVGSRPSRARLPHHLGAHIGETVALEPLEQRYYTRHGGGAEKRRYRGPDGASHNVLHVLTDSPLRHLHDPADCLLGAGHRVSRKGFRSRGAPTLLLRSVDPSGHAWRIEASFVSERGEFATGVSEVIWRWLGDRAVTWMLVQRITPWSLCEDRPHVCRRFDSELFQALDLTRPPVVAPGRHATPASHARDRHTKRLVGGRHPRPGATG